MHEETPNIEDLYEYEQDTEGLNTADSRLRKLRILIMGAGISAWGFEVAMAQIAYAGREEIRRAKQQAVDHMVATNGLELQVYAYRTPSWEDQLKELAACEPLVYVDGEGIVNECFQCFPNPIESCTKPTYRHGLRLFNRRARDAL